MPRPPHEVFRRRKRLPGARLLHAPRCCLRWASPNICSPTRWGGPIAAAYRRSLPPGSSTKLSRASRHWVLLVRLGRPPGLTPPAGSRSNSPVRTGRRSPLSTTVSQPGSRVLLVRRPPGPPGPPIRRLSHRVSRPLPGCCCGATPLRLQLPGPAQKTSLPQSRSMPVARAKTCPGTLNRSILEKAGGPPPAGAPQGNAGRGLAPQSVRRRSTTTGAASGAGDAFPRSGGKRVLSFCLLSLHLSPEPAPGHDRGFAPSAGPTAG